MAIYKYDNSSGLVNPDSSQVIKDTQDWWKSITGDQVIPDTGSIEGRLIDAEAMARISAIELVSFMMNQINPNTSTGNYLDALCALSGTKRRKQEKSTIECEIRGTLKTVIPAGSQISDKSNRSVWTLKNQVVITKNPMVATFVCSEFGQIEADEGTVTEISTQILGWDSVRNISRATGGRTQQTDEELRSERRRELALNSRTGPLSVISAISALNGVKAVSYRENYTSKEMGFGNLVLLPHSVYVCVDGGDDHEIADAYQIKSAGSAYSASSKTQKNAGIRTEVDWVDPYSGQLVLVAFDRPRIKKIAVKIKITANTSNDISKTIQQLIYDYSRNPISSSNGFSLGVDLSTFEIAGHLNKSMPQLFIYELSIGVKGVPDSMSCATIKNELYEKAYIESLDDIEVEIANE